MKVVTSNTFLLIILLTLVSLSTNLKSQDKLTDFNIYSTIDNEITQIKVVLKSGNNTSILTGNLTVTYKNKDHNLFFKDGHAYLPIEDIGSENELIYVTVGNEQKISKLYFFNPEKSGSFQIKAIPFWLSIVPPLLAIILALVFREVIFSLFAGIWFGSFVIMGGRWDAIFDSLFAVVDSYSVKAVNNSSHASIIIFSLLIGGMVAIISKNGGMNGFIKLLSRYAKSARSTQLISWFTGLVIFFDDYANTLIVGNTLRPLTDKFRISREKLAYIVDSTAAPIASVAFISSWIGYELGEIDTVLKANALLNDRVTAYQVFLGSLRYAYYPVLTLVFMFILIWSNRDFGTMFSAEKRSRISGQTYFSLSSKNPASRELDMKEGLTGNPFMAILPIVSLVAVVFLMLVYYPGSSGIWGDDSLSFFNKLQTVVGNADPYLSLLWGSSAGVLSAVLLSVLWKKLSLHESAEAMVEGFKSMLNPIIILVLAWSLAAVTTEMHTADFIISLIPDSFNPRWLPAITFIMAALISFGTGSSWGTMAILFPIVLPLSFAQGMEYYGDIEEVLPIFFNVASVILAGSVFGDHCSPISDTTILSSLASQCDHIEHVRTQLPYAITVGMISILCGGVLFAVNLPWWIAYLLGIGLIVMIIKVAGKEVPEAGETQS